MADDTRLIPLPPFKSWLASNIPAVYDNTMTYYEELCAMISYLEKQVTPAVNANTTGLAALKKYVEDYFKDLDIQTEIDNKLDEMAESGQLAEIIAQYIELNGVLAYDTKTQLKAANNLVNGSICETLGATTITDGKGSLYKIRTITSSDVVDDENIVALANYPTLIAQRTNKVISNKLVIIGDSWSMNNYPYVTNQNSMWYRKYAKLNNLDVISYAESGAGYTVSNNTFEAQADDVIANEDPDNVKQIIIFGGLNDRGGYTYGSNTLYNACRTILDKLKAAFPNADIVVIAMNIPDGLMDIKDIAAKTEIENATLSKSARFINCTLFMQGYSTFFEGGTNHHPNEYGQEYLAGMLNSAINGTFERGVVTVDNTYTVTKGSQWAPDLTCKLTFYNNKYRFNISLTATSGYQADFTATYTIPAFDLNYARFTSPLFTANSPSTPPCLISKGSSANQINIIVPQGQTGTWTGSFEVDV